MPTPPFRRLPSPIILLAIAVLACGGGNASGELQQIADEYWERQLEDQIFLRLRHGLPIERLPDLSLEKAQADSVFLTSILDRLESVDEGNLSHDEVLSRRVLMWEAELAAEGTRFYWLSAPVMPYSSPLRVVNQVFAAYRFDEASDLDGYVALLGQYPSFVRALHEKLVGREERGIVLPQPEIGLVVPYLTAAMGPAGKSSLAVDPARVEHLDAEQIQPFQRQVDEIISTNVVPAFERLLTYIQGEYATKAPPGVGLAQYPGGEEYYRYLARFHTTMDVTPEEIHQIGLDEVERLSAALDAVKDAVGFSGSRAEFRQFLRTDARFFPKSADEIGEKLGGFAEQMESKIDDFFLRRPKAPYGVQRLAPELEPAMTFGYYNPPTSNESRGLYYYNGSKLGERNMLMTEGLSYHELVPGHHFQINFQYENTDLPDFRREAGYSAYTEGWGDYSSNIGFEMGLYQDPYSRAGRYLMEMFLSVRLVVDTGMNLLGWSRERAMDYMRDHVIESETQIQTESLRYSVDIPGQALAYKMGSRRWLELRQIAEDALGDRFDVRRFHDAVLSTGSLPMTILEHRVEWFVEQER